MARALTAAALGIILGVSSVSAQAPPRPPSTPQVSAAVARHLANYQAMLKDRLRIKVTAETLTEWRLARQREKDVLAEALDAARSDDELLGVHGSALEGMHDEIALDAARKALKVAPKPLAWHYQGIAYAALNLAGYSDGAVRTTLQQEAKESIVRALALDGSARTWILAGQVHMASGDVAGAKTAYSMALQVGPRPADRTLIFQGLWRVAMAQNEAPEAAKWFLELVKVNGATDADHYDNGNFQIRSESWEGAAATFTRLAQKPDQSTPVDTFKLLYSAAYAHWMIGQLDAARPLASRAILDGAGKPDSARTVAQAHSILAHMFMADGQFDLAKEAGRRGVAEDPAYHWAHTQLSRALNVLMQYGEAEVEAAKGIELSKGADFDAHFELGMAHFGQKRWEPARQSFEEAARLDKANPYSAYNIAQALVNSGREKDAIGWYEEALRRDPKIKERDAILAAIARIRGRL